MTWPTMEAEVREQVEQAVRFAEESPVPAPEELITDVYANPMTLKNPMAVITMREALNQALREEMARDRKCVSDG